MNRQTVSALWRHHHVFLLLSPRLPAVPPSEGWLDCLHLHVAARAQARPGWGHRRVEAQRGWRRGLFRASRGQRETRTRRFRVRRLVSVFGPAVLQDPQVLSAGGRRTAKVWQSSEFPDGLAYLLVDALGYSCVSCTDRKPWRVGSQWGSNFK